MSTDTDNACDLRICSDCLFIIANGENGEWGEGEYAEWEARCEAAWPTKHTITLGRLHASYHNADHDAETCVDCDDNLGFSWRSCDYCRSPLGGERYAATVWIEAGEEVQS